MPEDLQETVPVLPFRLLASANPSGTLGALKSAREYVYNSALLLVAKTRGWDRRNVPGTNLDVKNFLA